MPLKQHPEKTYILGIGNSFSALKKNREDRPSTTTILALPASRPTILSRS
jgi:hypothetical protein